MADYPFRVTEKWDVHTHTTLSPETFHKLEKFAASYARFVRVQAHPTQTCCAQMVNGKGEVQRVIEDDAYNPVSRLEACDQHGVTRQVLSPTPMMIPDYVDNPADAATICQILNDDNQRLVETFPDRFVALGALPMRHPERAEKEMRRLKAMGMKGVEINSNVDGRTLDSPEFLPIFQAAEELDLAVFLHPWGGFMFPTQEELRERMNPQRHWLPWLAAMPLETALAFDALMRAGIHEKLPRLRVLYAHGGGAFPALLGRMEHGSYCRPDLFARTSEKDAWRTVRECGVYTDSLTHNPWALKMLVDILGSERIAMGSDYPYPLGEIDPFHPVEGFDPKGNSCPYPSTKGIYPGHMIEHLPSAPEHQEEAWSRFEWLPRDNAEGPRDLPQLSPKQKENMLFKTAKQWLAVP